jgi:hypothetical protein
VPIALKSGNLNFLKRLEPAKACNWISLPDGLSIISVGDAYFSVSGPGFV